MNVPFFNINYGEEEEAAILQVLRSKWISMGPKVDEFEARFAEMHGSRHAVAVSNCTSALHLALRASGVGRGDEVILPSLSFVATAAAVLMTGARPVFSDIASIDDWTIGPEDFESRINSRTKAVIPMHYGGFGADMKFICSIAEKHGLTVVEDACHAPLGTRDGQRLGTFGELACYSFYSNKNISTGEGGMILTQDRKTAERLRLLRSHGMTTSAYERVQGREFYDVEEFGYNYRMDDLHAALGLAQLNKLEASNRLRAERASRYRENLGAVPDIFIPFNHYPGDSANHLMSVLVPDDSRQVIASTLKDEGIGTSMHYPPIHQFSCFEEFSSELPLTERIGRQELTLPLYPTMSVDAVDHVCERFVAALSK